MYEDVLRSVRYRLAKGSARFERRFRLSCSEMNGRYTSNELTLEVRTNRVFFSSGMKDEESGRENLNLQLSMQFF